MNYRIPSGVVESGKVWGLILFIVAIAFVVTYQFVEPPPPNTVRIATGDKDGAYYAFAQRYAALLAQDDITLEIVPTAGSVENLALLKKGEVSFALVQGGTASEGDKAELQSLGSMFLEPLWILTGKKVAIKRLADLKGKRVAIGPAGSGTHMLAIALLAADGIGRTDATFIDQGGLQAAALLVGGKIDAVFLVASPTSPTIRKLLEKPAVQLFSFTRAPAYAYLFPFLRAVTLYEGVLDLARNIPSRDTTLVTVAANLAARQDLNSNLVPALMHAVTRIHQEAGVLARPGQFPSVDLIELPLNTDARYYIKNGPSFLFRWLPYTAAVYLDRLKIMLVPFIALMIPLFRLAPQIYRWRIRHKIYRWYEEVREIDATLQDEPRSVQNEGVISRLKNLEHEVASVSVPLSYAGELYNLRLHIRLLADKIAAISTESTAHSEEKVRSAQRTAK
ncbi:MAG TPA: TAXI family TRAP transporter solute-binding subunit [Candidatus Binatia bacterium]|nr:TAXI family TRAP transporter solute-binding subunit [Candidatus Binatia bacterium]